MFRDDHRVRPRSGREIEDIALAWREALGVKDAWVVPVVETIESKLPSLLPEFTFRVLPAADMGGAEGIARCSPPEIILSEGIYLAALGGNARARFTAAHELGHFVLSAGEASARQQMTIRHVDRSYMSAERQANLFAASFLMPRFVVEQFESPLDLAEGCSVGPSAAEIRMKALDLWPKRREIPENVAQLLNELKKKSRKR